MRTAKTLIRPGGCPGWSESSLGARHFVGFVMRPIISGVPLFTIITVSEENYSTLLHIVFCTYYIDTKFLERQVLGAGLGKQCRPRSDRSSHGSNTQDRTKFPDNSRLFPDINSNFPEDIKAENFINRARMVHQGQTSKLLHDWNVFPDILTKSNFSLTDLKMPWQFPDIEKNLNFPDISLTCINPALRRSSLIRVYTVFCLHVLDLLLYGKAILFNFRGITAYSKTFWVQTGAVWSWSM